jgi:hypothetical protein
MKTWVITKPKALPKEKYPKIEVDGWVDTHNKQPQSGAPRKCPKCGNWLHKVDCQRLNGKVYLFCEKGLLKNKEGYKVIRCLWMGIYEA